MKKTFNIVLLSLLCSTAWAGSGSDYTVSSPNGKIKMTLGTADDALQYTLVAGSDTLLHHARMGLTLADGTVIGAGKSIKGEKRQQIKESGQSLNYRQSQIDITFNQLTLTLKNGFAVQVRVSDQGAAYRFVSQRKGTTLVKSETADFRLGRDREVWLSYTTNDKKPMAMAFQNYYDDTKIRHAKNKMAFLPATIAGDAHKLTILESDVEAYPGMFLQADTVGESLVATQPQYPDTYDYYPWRVQQYVTSTKDYIARLDGARTLPWRVLAVTEKDTEMPTNDLVYALASPSRVKDTAWIKGGKVAWDWWCDWNIKGVPFRAGINQDTYKYYIDFAASHGLEYVVLDEGWYNPKSGDMLTVIPELNLPELVQYAQQKGVSIILWTVFNVLDKQLEEACQKYSQMGVVGFKVDFLDRNDQTAAEMTYRIAEACARHHMTLDLHGFYTPTGLNRTFPNIINFESVFGMEEMKWSDPSVNMPLYDVTFPYIRMMAGPVDFTPGAMRNASRKDWAAVYSEPMSMGTRAHEAAKYVVHDSPLTMLADAPSNYMEDETYTRFIAAIPNKVQRTFLPQGEMGKYIVSVRETSDGYYVAGMTNWDARDITLPLDFLPAGTFKATILKDGINADRKAEDYVIEESSVTSSTTLPIHMASGGGFVIKLKK